MDSPPQAKTLKQVQLCFKSMSAKQCVQAKRKRKSADLIIGHNEAKTLKISENGVDKCLQINIERCDDKLINNRVEHKGNFISGTSKSINSASNNRIASYSVGEMIVCETNDKCADEKRVNSPTSIDIMNSSLTEKNCDTSIVTNDDASDKSVVTLSSSSEEESPPNQGFSVFSSSSTNTINSANDVPSLKHAVVGEGECSEKTDVVSEKRDSIKDNLLSEQANPPAEEKPRRKRKKMSSSEAQLKAEEREKKIKEKEIQRKEKERELQAKKEQRTLLKKQRTLLKEQKQQEKEKLKLEKQRKKEQEEKERERLKQEKKEQEEREKQKKLLEKEEKNRLKQQLVEVKMEEKKKKEQKLKVIEEKKKTEMQEEKNIEKSKAAFANYFLKSKTIQSPQVSNNVTGDQGMFRPFQVKENMQLAPIVPMAAKERFNKINLDQSLKTQDNTVLYLDAIRSGKHLAFKHKKAKCKKIDSSNEDDDVIMLDSKDEGMVILDLKEGEEGKQIADKNLKAKLLQFSENIRPPYWGTWRKKSKNIGPRNPLGLDKIFDYDVDSDDEWDEGGPGESLSGTEDEESEDDYEVDNKFFVPHGYLSADEEKDDLVTDNPELHQARLKMKEREFQSERSKKTTVLRPSLIGCFWQADNVVGASCLLKILNPFSASIIASQPITTNYSLLQTRDSAYPQLGVERTSPVNEITPPKPASYIKVKRPVPEEAIPYLIRLLHGNTHNRQTVIKEFQEFWRLYCCKKRVEMVIGDSAEPTLINALSPACNEKLASDKHEAFVEKPPYEKIYKRQMDLTIQKLCVWCRCPDNSMNKFCWWVHEEVREKYDLSDLPVPNKWSYVTKKDTENTKPVSQATTPSIKTFLHP